MEFERKIDDFGRISLPAEFRRNMKVREGDFVTVVFDDAAQAIIVKRSNVNSCSLCGQYNAPTYILNFEGIASSTICSRCWEAIRNAQKTTKLPSEMSEAEIMSVLIKKEL